MKGGQEAIHILIKDLSLYHLASFFSALHVWCKVSWYKASGQIKRNDGKQNWGRGGEKEKTNRIRTDKLFRVNFNVIAAEA